MTKYPELCGFVVYFALFCLFLFMKYFHVSSAIWGLLNCKAKVVFKYVIVSQRLFVNSSFSLNHLRQLTN